MKRGNVILLDFPFQDNKGSKIRPALVVQNDHDNQRLANTIVAMITGNLQYAHEPANLLIDPKTKDGAASGLHGPSVVKCGNLFTVPQTKILHVIGRISRQTTLRLNRCLKAALGIP